MGSKCSKNVVRCLLLKMLENGASREKMVLSSNIIRFPRPLYTLQMFWPKPQTFSNPRNQPMVTRMKITKHSRAMSSSGLSFAHYLICMTAGSVSKIAHTWPERETQFVTTFLHQMLTAKLIKLPVNPYEMLHVPELSRCHFNFRSRHSLLHLARALTRS